ncbi:MAG: GH92 family glycosyl hydrolase [Phycisphaerae bacterium]
MTLRFGAFVLGAAFLAAAGRAWGDGVVDSVNPMIGTGGHGHVFPGATVPFGMVQVSPDTRDRTWDGSSGYHDSDATIMGFSQNHLSGTGVGDLGNVLLMPAVGEASAVRLADDADPAKGYRQTFSHAEETARPGYYAVRLKESGVKVELTATTRVGLQRYTFPAAGPSHVILDLWHGINNNPTEALATVEDDHTITGYRRSKGWGGEKVFYFVVEFSKPFASYALQMDNRMTDEKEAKAGSVRGRFDFETGAGERVIAKVALSTVSVEGAKRNLAAEMPGWDFDASAADAAKEWEGALSSVGIETKDESLRRTFCTALYHTMMAPTILSDVDGQVRGPDGKVHTASGFNYYTEMSLWDTFRAENPLLTLTQPQRVNDLVKTMLAHCRWYNGKTLPVWTNAGKETWCMIGNHAIPVIVNAYMNGFRDFDALGALHDMISSVGMDHDLQKQYAALGYVPTYLDRAGKGQKSQTVARTLEYAYDDACISRFAAALGQKEVAEKFAKRAENWRNVFDASTGFMRGRMPDGAWVDVHPGWENRINFDYYTEANAWHYTFFVPQDVRGLIEAMGGDEKFVRKLDACFDSTEAIPNPLVDVSGLIGMYAHGNEPCHHMPYLYVYAGQPWKTQARVRQVATTLYNDSVGGICGNDDCGQMSAWYVFSAMGFYPVDPTSGVYVIGSPLVDRAVIRLDPRFYPQANPHSFTVIAENNSAKNVYVQSAMLNGKPLTHAWIAASDVARGGELRLVLGATPNKAWGSATAERPGVLGVSP